MNRVKFVREDIYNFIKSFDNKFVAKIFALLEVLDESGIYLGSRNLKKITGEIYELRISGKVQVRIFCCFKDNKIYLLHAFVKKTQKIPKNELYTAINRLRHLH